MISATFFITEEEFKNSFRAEHKCSLNQYHLFPTAELLKLCKESKMGPQWLMAIISGSQLTKPHKKDRYFCLQRVFLKIFSVLERMRRSSEAISAF